MKKLLLGLMSISVISLTSCGPKSPKAEIHSGVEKPLSTDTSTFRYEENDKENLVILNSTKQEIAIKITDEVKEIMDSSQEINKLIAQQKFSEAWKIIKTKIQESLEDKDYDTASKSVHLQNEILVLWSKHDVNYSPQIAELLYQLGYHSYDYGLYDMALESLGFAKQISPEEIFKETIKNLEHIIRTDMTTNDFALDYVKQYYNEVKEMLRLPFKENVTDIVNVTKLIGKLLTPKNSLFMINNRWEKWAPKIYEIMLQILYKGYDNGLDVPLIFDTLYPSLKSVFEIGGYIDNQIIISNTRENYKIIIAIEKDDYFLAQVDK